MPFLLNSENWRNASDEQIREGGGREAGRRWAERRKHRNRRHWERVSLERLLTEREIVVEMESPRVTRQVLRNSKSPQVTKFSILSLLLLFSNTAVRRRTKLLPHLTTKPIGIFPKKPSLPSTSNPFRARTSTRTKNLSITISNNRGKSECWT